MFTVCIFFFVLIGTSYTSGFDPLNVRLCRENFSTSCNYLFGDLNEYPSDFCWKYSYTVNNQSICDAEFDENAVRTKNIDYGKLILSPFQGDTRTIFNVTFVSIKFLKLRFKFQEYRNGLKEKNKCMVKQFVLQSKLESDKVFSYVCPWTDASFEGYSVDFQYEYGIENYETRKKYRFMVPKHEYLTGYAIKKFFFIYVDYTNLSNLTLKLNPTENINQFNVKVIFTLDNISSVKSEVNLTSGQDSFSFNTYLTPGEYHFLVKPISNYCLNIQYGCMSQETPKIYIDEKSSSLLIGMVGVSLMIPIFMIIVYMWTKKWPGKLKPQPTVLLVTVPTNDAHVILSPIFAQFLNETLNIKVLLDLNEVPKTNKKNSYDWLKFAISQCSHIIFLRSNDDLNISKVIYQSIYEQTIHLLEPKLNPNRKNECVVSFNFSSENIVPELIHISKRFHFEKEFNKLAKFLGNKRGSIKNFKNYTTYQKLLEAIESIQSENPVNIKLQNIDVQIPVSDENSDEYSENLNENICKNKYENMNIKVDLDVSKYNILGDQHSETNNENIQNDDSDLEDFNFFGT